MRVKDQLRSVNVRPVKERGQNFLLDSGAIQDILRFGEIKQNESIIEIGPGLGALTKELVQIADVTVIELERNFCRKLAEELPQIKIINEDVRKIDFSTLGTDLVIFGNLPYSLSTDIVFHILSFRQCISRAVFMLQKEFVERMVAKPGGKDYGALSIGCQLEASLTSGPVISGDLFHPPTKVNSQVVELKFFKEDPFKLTKEDREKLRRTVKASFFRRRKKLPNSIKASCFFDSRIVDEALKNAEIDPNRRGETLSIPEFIALSKQLSTLKYE